MKQDMCQFKEIKFILFFI